MRCSGFKRAICLTMAGGVLVVLGSTNGHRAAAADIGPTPQTVRDNEEVEPYRYEFPEDDFQAEDSIATAGGSEVGSVEEYDYKYGYEYAQPEERFGYGENADDGTPASDETPDGWEESSSAQDEAGNYDYDAYDYEQYDDRDIGTNDESATEETGNESACDDAQYDSEFDRDAYGYDQYDAYGEYGEYREDAYTDDESVTDEPGDESAYDDAQYDSESEDAYEYDQYDAYGEYDEDTYADDDESAYDNAQYDSESEDTYGYDEYDAYGEYDEDTYADDDESAYDNAQYDSESEDAYEYDEYDAYGEYGEYREDAYTDDESATDEPGNESACDDAQWDDGYGRYGNEYDEPSGVTPEEEPAYDDGQWDYESEYGEESDSPGDYDDGQSDWEYDEYDTYDENDEWNEETDTSDESAYESHPWESEYGHYGEDGYRENLNEETTDEQDSEIDAWESDDEESRFGYEGYSEAYPDEEFAYPTENAADADPDAMDDDSCYDDSCEHYEREQYDSWEDEYGYKYDYPEQEYLESQAADEAANEDSGHESRWEGEPGEVMDYDRGSAREDYDESDPEACYGYEYGWEEEDADTSRTVEDEFEDCAETSKDTRASGLELFAWLPGELLIPPDEDLLRSLERACEEPSGVRRSALNDYLENLGSEAIEFGSRFEDSTGIEVLGLADDLPGAAAFLGCFRLIEQGELGVDEAANLLHRSLPKLSEEWVDGVGDITADAFEYWDEADTPAPRPMAPQPMIEETVLSAGAPVLAVVVSAIARSLDDFGGAVRRISLGISDVDWETLTEATATERAASHVDWVDDWYQR